MFLLFGFSEKFLNPLRLKSISISVRVLRILFLLMVGPGLVTTFYIKMNSFPWSLFCVVLLFYFKLALWIMISKCRIKQRAVCKSEAGNLKWVTSFLLMNAGLSLPVAAIPTLMSAEIEPVQIMGVFSLLFAIDLILISIQSGILKRKLKKIIHL